MIAPPLSSLAKSQSTAVATTTPFVAHSMFPCESTRCEWVELPEPFVAKDGYFVTRVIGESMNRRIPNGSWCLFRHDPGGSRRGKVVLVQHRDIQDHENGGQFTVKIYESEKKAADGSWKHGRIVLRPDSTQPGYEPIILEPDQTRDLIVLGELVAVLGQT